MGWKKQINEIFMILHDNFSLMFAHFFLLSNLTHLISLYLIDFKIPMKKQNKINVKLCMRITQQK